MSTRKEPCCLNAAVYIRQKEKTCQLSVNMVHLNAPARNVRHSVELDFFNTNRTYVGCTIQSGFFFNIQIFVLSIICLQRIWYDQYTMCDLKTNITICIINVSGFLLPSLYRFFFLATQFLGIATVVDSIIVVFVHYGHMS